MEGIPLIAELVARSRGRVAIIPGCGIHSGNVKTILEKTGAREIHIGNSVHNLKEDNSVKSMVAFGSQNVVDAKKVEKILQVCREVVD
jgi:copper homeostasis protein